MWDAPFGVGEYRLGRFLELEARGLGVGGVRDVDLSRTPRIRHASKLSACKQTFRPQKRTRGWIRTS
eukprot:968250-Rhodomonas_salina.3